MKIHKEDRKNWSTQSGRAMKSSIRLRAGEDMVEIDGKNSDEALVINQNSINLALTRKQKNMMKKIDNYKASILLHPSLVFIKSGLYINSSLKKASSILENSFLKPLVDDGYLIAIRNGLKCRKSKVNVYVKMVPFNDEESKEAFNSQLKMLNDERLNLDSYLASCNVISFHCSGVITKEVMDVLALERYQMLKVDLSAITQLASSIRSDEFNSKTIIVF